MNIRQPGWKKIFNLPNSYFRRRVLLNSRDSPVNVSNAGSFSKNWIVLMSDVLAHAGYSSVTTHPLKAIWIEGHSQQVRIMELCSYYMYVKKIPSRRTVLCRLDAWRGQRRDLFGDARGDFDALGAKLGDEERLVPGASKVDCGGAAILCLADWPKGMHAISEASALFKASIVLSRVKVSLTRGRTRTLHLPSRDEQSTLFARFPSSRTPPTAAPGCTGRCTDTERSSGHRVRRTFNSLRLHFLVLQ